MKNLGILLAIVVAGVVAYKWAYPSVSVRYRMTTVAELDGKQSSGSNVMEVTYYKNVRLLGASADMQIGIRGEATSIDFGSRRLLAVLLARGEHSRSDPENIIPFAYGLTKGGIGPEYFPRIAELSGQRELPRELFPAVVFFRDSLDPTSVELVNPPAPAGRSTAVPQLVSITLEIIDTKTWTSGLPFVHIFTAEPTIRSIDQALPWLRDNSARLRFWKTLIAERYQPSGSTEIYTLFKMEQ
ncbi:MAG: hypothetical protein BGP05_06170 [Rhizobiales bacterium 62-47]|nr:hypothetical protein [Hyphomicrobiales bacterium]OJY08453.1 MAG: hypothetical protein BGP05_06170 [Rhizobiales bacterium 62-47]